MMTLVLSQPKEVPGDSRAPGQALGRRKEDVDLRLQRIDLRLPVENPAGPNPAR